MIPKTIPLEHLNQTLMQFGQNIGLGDFALDEDRSASLIFDDRFMVELQALDCEGNNIRTLYFISVLCADGKHKDDKEAIDFYQKLLQSNLSGKAMNGASFAFDKEYNEILLLKPLSAYQLEIESLEIEMEKFVNVLEQWAARLKNGTLDWSHDESKEAKKSNGSAAHNHNDLGSVRV